MCLSNVYDKAPTQEHLLMRNVQNIRIEGNQICLTDIMECTRTLTGALVYADLVNGTVIVDTEQNN